MCVAALFLVAVAKSDGDMTKGHKEKILSLFSSELNLSDSKARELLGSSVHIFGRGDDVLGSFGDIEFYYDLGWVQDQDVDITFCVY